MKLFVSFLFGLLAEIATGLVIGAGMAITNRGMSPSNPATLPPWVPVVGIGGGALFTFLIALWRTSRVRERFMTHAALVAAGAVTLHLVTFLGAGGHLTPVYAAADALKFLVSAGAGALARRRQSSRNEGAPVRG